MEGKKVSQLWYVRRGNAVKGPFTLGLVRRYALLGRISANDQLSPDREQWKALAGWPELIPEEIKHLDTPEDLQRLELARRREDERLHPDRRQDRSPAQPEQEQRHGGDRRASEGAETLGHRHAVAEFMGDLREQRPRYRTQMVITAVLVVGVVAAYLLAPGTREPTDLRQCDAPPRAGINWSTCKLGGLSAVGATLEGAQARNVDLTAANLSRGRLRGSDLSYAVLDAADLSGADLSQSTLVGASLRGAQLAGADLRGSDLSYADLTGATLERTRLEGARFDKAIWPDRTECSPGSEGGCLVPAR